MNDIRPLVIPPTERVVPFVYDPGMSVYEILSKMGCKINELVDRTNDLDPDVANYIGDSVITHYWQPTFLGRYVDRYDPGSEERAQGCALVGDNTLIFTLHDTRSNDSHVVTVDLPTMTVTYEADLPWSHCNSMCWSPDLGKLLVCPNYRYEGESTTVYLDSVYEVDLSTHTISSIQHYPTMNPHSITYDPVEQKYYMTAENHPGVSVYDYDPVMQTVSYKFDIQFPNSGNSTIPLLFGGGTQTLKAYDGHLYYTMGGAATNIVFEVDPENGRIESIENISATCFIYKMTELQDIAFTSRGDIIGVARAKTSFPQMYNGYYTPTLIFGLSSGGHMVYDSYIDFIGVQRDSTHWDPSKNKNYCLYQDGSSQYPYAYIRDAMSAIMNGQSIGLLRVDADGTIDDPIIVPNNCTCTIEGQNHTITINTAMRCTFFSPVYMRDITFNYTPSGSQARPFDFNQTATLNNCVFNAPNATGAVIGAFAAVILGGNSDVVNASGVDINCNNRGYVMFGANVPELEVNAPCSSRESQL